MVAVAESYRGLTIRIGADASELKSVLKSVTEAASTAQSWMTRLEKSAKIDPAGITSLALRADALSERVEEAALRLRTLREAEAEIGANDAVAQMARTMRNVSLETSDALAKYNALDNELAIFRNHVKDIAAQTGNGKMFDRDDLLGTIERLRQAGVQVDGLADSYRHMAEVRGEALRDYELKRQVAQLRDLRVEQETAAAEARRLAQELVRVQSAASLSARAGSGYEELGRTLEGTRRAADALETEFKSLDDAVKMDPTNAEAVLMRIRNLREQASGAEVELEQVTAQLRMMREAYPTRAQTGDMALSLEDARSQAVRARAALEETRSEVDRLEQRAETLRAQAVNTGARSEEAIEKAKAELRETTERADALRRELPRLKAEAKAAMDAFETADAQGEIRRLETQVTGLRSKVESLNSATREAMSFSGVAGGLVRSLGISLSSTLTPAVMMAGHHIVDSADTIDTAYRSMRKTVDGTEQQFESLRQAAIETSQTSAISADTILDIEALGGQMGIAVESLEDFGRVVSYLDIATNLDAEDIALDLGHLANITHMTTEEYEGFGDALVRLGNNLPTQESDIMNISSRIGSMASIIGMSADEILAWSAALASTGQKPEAAGTALSKTFSDINTAVVSGGDSLEGFAQVAGMTAQEFATAWRTSPSEAMRAFVNGLRLVELAGGSADVTLMNLGITGVRQKQALLGLSQETATLADGTNVLNDALRMSSDAFQGIGDQWGAAGDAAREAGKKSEGFSGTLDILKNNAAALGTQLGDGMLPIMQLLSGALQTVSTAFGGMSPKLKTTIIVMGGLAAAAGPALNFLGSMSESTKNLTENLNRYVPVLRGSIGAHSANAAAMNLENVATSAGAMGTLKLGAARTALTVATAASTVATRALNAAMIAMPIVGLITAITTVVGLMGGWIESMAKARKENDELLKGASDLAAAAEVSAGEHASLMQSLDQTATQTEATTGRIQELAAEYESLSGAEDDDMEAMARRQGIVQELTALSDGFAAAVAEEGDAHALTAERVRELADAEEARIRGEAAQERFNKLVNEQVTKAQELADARETQAEAEAALAEMEWVNAPFATVSFEDMQRYWDLAEAVRQAQGATSQYEGELAELDSRLKDVKGELTEQAMHEESLKLALEATGGNYGLVAEMAERYGVTTEELTAALDAQRRAAEEEAQALHDELSDALSTLAGESDRVRAAVSASGYDIETLTDVMIACGISADDLASRVNAMADSATNAFDAMTVNAENGASTAMANLETSYATMAQWKENLVWLFSESGLAFNDEFLAQLEQGPEVMGQVVADIRQAYADGSDGVIDEFGNTGQDLIDQFAINANLAGDAAVTELLGSAGALSAAAADAGSAGATGLSDTQEEFRDASETNVGSAVDAVKAGATDIAGAASQAGQQAVTALSAYAGQATSLGYDFAAGYASGITSGESVVASAAASLVQQALAQVQSTQASHSPAKASMSLGDDFGAGYGLGIANRYDYISRQAEGAVDRAMGAMRANPDRFTDMASESTSRLGGWASARSAMSMAAAMAEESGGPRVAVYVDGEVLAINTRLEGKILDIAEDLCNLGGM